MTVQLKRFSGELFFCVFFFEVYSVGSVSVVSVSSSTAFLISGPVPISIFLAEQ